MKNKTLYIILLFSAFFIRGRLAAQYHLFSNFGESAFVDVKNHTGKPIRYSDSLNYSLQNYFTTIDLRFGINSFGRTPQDEFLKYPNYGVGFTHYYLNSDTLGNPIGIYGFFGSPFLVHNSKLHLGWELAMGFSYNFNKFDLLTNPKNDLIGSNINVYFNMSLWAAIRMSERLDLLLTSDFTHFSNGTVNTPNKGLNLLGGNLGLRYHFQFEEKGNNEFIRKTKATNTFGEFKPYNEFTVWGGLGAKAVLNATYDGPVYLCSSISADFNHRYGWIGKFGVGTDLFYDGSLTADFPNEDNIPRSRFMFVGIHGSHEFIVANISLATQVGFYVWKGMPAKGNFFIRAALRFDITKHLFLNLALKSVNGLKADYIEAGFGVRIFGND